MGLYIVATEEEKRTLAMFFGAGNCTYTKDGDLFRLHVTDAGLRHLAAYRGDASFKEKLAVAARNETEWTLSVLSKMVVDAWSVKINDARITQLRKGMGVVSFDGVTHQAVPNAAQWKESFDRVRRAEGELLMETYAREYVTTTASIGIAEGVGFAIGRVAPKVVNFLRGLRGTNAPEVVVKAESRVLSNEAVSETMGIPRTPVVIGEDMMGRVNPYARNVGGQTVDDWLAGRQWTQQLNDEFIESVKAQGREVIDIGPAFGRRLQNRVDSTLGRPPSSVYGGERRALKGYDNYSQVYEREGMYQGGVPGFDQ